jgi:hypothetical protein
VAAVGLLRYYTPFDFGNAERPKDIDRLIAGCELVLSPLPHSTGLQVRLPMPMPLTAPPTWLANPSLSLGGRNERPSNRAVYKVMVTATRLEQLALAAPDTCVVSEINELREFRKYRREY